MEFQRHGVCIAEHSANCFFWWMIRYGLGMHLTYMNVTWTLLLYMQPDTLNDLTHQDTILDGIISPHIDNQILVIHPVFMDDNSRPHRTCQSSTWPSAAECNGNITMVYNEPWYQHAGAQDKEKVSCTKEMALAPAREDMFGYRIDTWSILAPAREDMFRYRIDTWSILTGTHRIFCRDADWKLQIP